MKFALVNGLKSEAIPDTQGVCLFCKGQMVARCGKHNMWHWAHHKRSNCDPWWENETDWHRKWKNYFPAMYQEVAHIDALSGERHIADVKTQNGMVIEFQNSLIKPAEVLARESFYKKMMWVVNGDKNNTLDKRSFYLSTEALGYTVKSQDPVIIEFLWVGRSKLFARWMLSNVPVFFDFGSTELFWLKNYDATTKRVTVRVIQKTELIEKNGGMYN